MNICFCKRPISYYYDIKKNLYICQKCGKHIIPGRYFNRFKKKAELNLKNIFHIILDIFKPI